MTTQRGLGGTHLFPGPFTRFLALSVIVAALTAQSPRPAVETQRIPQFENAHVKVWKSVISPNAPLAPHRHEHGRVIIALQGGTLKVVEQSGASDTQVWETGKAYWLPANAPNTMHSDVNTGDRPIEVMVVEVKDDK
jgi:quercetin dioxygenase-like cupin family protein